MTIARLLAFTALVGAGACSEADRPQSDAPPADTGGIAVVALPTDLDYANILLTGDRYTQELLRYALFLPLVQYDSLLDYTPLLAENYTFEGDTAVTFNLRRDVFWHDGAHTTAYDVAFTFDRAADSATAFPNA